jgi:hypothetical protein
MARGAAHDSSSAYEGLVFELRLGLLTLAYSIAQAQRCADPFVSVARTPYSNSTLHIHSISAVPMTQNVIVFEGLTSFTRALLPCRYVWMCLGFKAKGFEEILKDSATQHFQTASGLNIAMADDDSWEDVAG